MTTEKLRVRRAVVDEEDLEGLVAGLEGRRNLAVQLFERPLLVVERDDDRDHAPRVQAGQAGGVPRYGCSMASLKTVDEALAAVLERVTPLAPERVAIGDAAGRVLASPAVALVDLPPFPSSAMDGFAVLSSDTPGTLPIASRIAAGKPAPAPLAPGTAAGISTGAAVPAGADAVVPIENVLEADGHVEIAVAVEPGAHVRPRGGDVVAGSVVVDSGARLGAWHVGALGAAGVPELDCSRRPRVAVLATGSELKQPGDDLEPGQIFESNGRMLAALLESGKVRTSSGSRRCRTTRTRIATRSREGSRRTCS